MSLNIDQVRQAFSVFRQEAPPIYLDSAATAQTPDIVIRTLGEYYTEYCANVHRGMHQLTEHATQAYEDARTAVAKCINASSPREIIFTKNGTEAINLAAHGWALPNLQPGQSVVTSAIEHHSNIVPWQQLSTKRDTPLHWLALGEDYRLDMLQLERLLSTQTIGLVAITGQSNVLGTRPDLLKVVSMCQAAGTKVLIDAAQLIVHRVVDVQELGCDFLTFSGHKLYGPTGIGVLYACKERQAEMQPFLGGGSMIQTVSAEGFTPAEPPHCFEAGTPPIAQAIGLKTAIEWLTQWAPEDRKIHERTLLQHARDRMLQMPQIQLLDPPHKKLAQKLSGCISFAAEGVHPHDLTDLLGQRGIAMRAGHHCTQPLHEALGVTASTRMSFGIYNTIGEVDAAIAAIEEAVEFLKK